MFDNRKYECGAVSLFIVIFAALLISVVTVSFIRIMVRDQQQATAIDLSQSAYDSAQAGVEDAKRALLRYETLCASDPASTACATAKTKIDSLECNESLDGIVTVTDNEVKVQQTAGDKALDQAYTCVKIDLQTDSYIGTLDKDGTKTIPLTGVSDFDSIRLDWFSAKDLQSDVKTIDVPSFTSGTPLLTQSSWISATTPNRPPVMRTQLMQFGSNGFLLSDFDGITNSANTSNTNTLFLYPSSIISSTSTSFASNTRQSPSAPTLAHCDATLRSGGYSCSATITLPNPIGGGTRTAYLDLSTLYRRSSYQVTLLSGSGVVQFDAVQPKVDSTGRANDLFRRVESRIETSGGSVYPYAAVVVTGNLCKNFSVADTASSYSASSCMP
jgi:Tfp pilus assembly protein PilX